MEKKTGKVFLTSAGPGDPELMTMRAYRCLQEADVVLADRLVSKQLLQKYLPATTILIHVGKQSRRGASTPQHTINQLMVAYALNGKTVVRLKGGDASIFSNILDELEALVAHEIPYEIIPGVTAALGAAAYAGIPLTARGYAASVRWLTCYQRDMVPENYWQELAATDDTLVFYMSGETVNYVVQKLTQYKIDRSKLLAIIESATTPAQRVEIYDLYAFEKKSGSKKMQTPALLIIGKVVMLHQKFKWLQNDEERRSCFHHVSAATISQQQENEILLTA